MVNNCDYRNNDEDEEEYELETPESEKPVLKMAGDNIFIYI